MFITVTIKAEAESKGELIDTFGAQVRNLRKHCEALRKEGIFGPEDQCEVRYLIVGGKWREPVEERISGTPDVE